MAMRKLCLIILLGFIWGMCYTQTNKELPSNPDIYNQKGDYYFDRYEFEKAIVFYNRSFKRNPLDNYALLRKAEAYSKLNLLKQAEQSYQMAIEGNSLLV